VMMLPIDVFEEFLEFLKELYSVEENYKVGKELGRFFVCGRFIVVVKVKSNFELLGSDKDFIGQLVAEFAQYLTGRTDDGDKTDRESTSS
jgi:hypothetical protein